jgi:lipoic acid synthetase
MHGERQFRDMRSELRKRKPKPSWLKAKTPSGKRYFRIRKELEDRQLHTICQKARCPNIGECWHNYHATFLILGDICSRNCSFCSVKSGKPTPVNSQEAEWILEMTEIMELKYVVITSVTRDDLPDGGSSQFAHVIRVLKSNKSNIKIEVLVPDFKGSLMDLETVLQAKPDVLNHNLETIRRLYTAVNRPEKNYDISLNVLKSAKDRGFITKSGIMVGLGEQMNELEKLFGDLRSSGVNLLTIGQYLQPTHINIPVSKYYTPEEFEELKKLAMSIGFTDVVSGPFIRSSYHAQEMFNKVDRSAKNI